MTEDSNKGKHGGEQERGYDKDTFPGAAGTERREPVFNDFDEDDEYEEPDRDTDYSSSYFDDDINDYLEEPEEAVERDVAPGFHGKQEELLREEGEPVDTDADWRDAPPSEESEWERPSSEDEDEKDALLEEWAEPDGRGDDQSGEQLFQQPYAQEDYERENGGWPLGLIAVALLAVILLAAGGYGVIQQRAATQEEIRQLRAELANAVAPAAVSESNAALAAAKQRNVELTVAMESLAMENRRLSDTVAGLEAQLEAQQEVLASPAPPAVATDPQPAPAAAPAAPETPPPAATPAATPTGGAWFVNFGSYSQRAMAESWAAKLRPGAGRSTVTSAEKDGKTFYRVRIVELDSRESADKVARQLESEYGLTRLWVGK